MREIAKNILNFKRSCYNIFLLIFVFLFFILPICFTNIAIFICISINILYLITSFIKIFLFFTGLKNYNYNKYFEKCKIKFDDKDLPIYSILLPVRNEKDFVIKKLLESLNNLDYPIEKLDIKLIVDEDDINTTSVAKILREKFIFDLIIVPKLEINSKPLSCNYALKFIKGDFVTIYDAEDRPEKYQLKKVIEQFNNSDPKTACIQCALNYYNKYDNFLSYCFSIEYSMWFDFTIDGILKYATFFPLGGTSNHFKTNKLLEVGSWDSYNVTEDAELGVRLAKAGYKITKTNSITLEECPITTIRWIHQRSRWIKGFMQTFFEHLIFSKPKGVKSDIKFKPIWRIGLANNIIFLIFVFMSFFFFLSLVFSGFYQYKIPNILFICNFVLLLLQLYFGFLITVHKNKLKFNLIYFICFPLYWVLHYAAGILATIDLIKNPFYWSKTEHGLDYSNTD